MSEHEELAALIEATADSHNGLWPGPLVGQLYRAAALLREARPRPVPVAERPWERPGWCDAEGECWWRDCRDPAWWTTADPRMVGAGWLLPHWAIPQPPQGGEVEA